MHVHPPSPQVPAGLDSEEALLGCDELCTALHAVTAMSQPIDRLESLLSQPAKKSEPSGSSRCFALLGCNLVGCLAIALLRQLFPMAQLIAADDDPERRKMAQMAGADHAVAPRDLRGCVDGLAARGCEGVIESVGRSTSVIKAALSIVADGGTLALVGSTVGNEPSSVLSPQVCSERHLTVRYGVGVHSMLRPMALDLLQTLQMRPSWKRTMRDVISERISLDMCQDAYEQASVKPGKLLLYPDTVVQMVQSNASASTASASSAGGALAATLD